MQKYDIEMISNNLNFYLKIKNMTQKDLAKLLAMEPCSLSNIINGRRTLNPDLLDKIAKLLEVDALELKNSTETDNLIFELEKMLCKECISDEEKERYSKKIFRLIQVENKAILIRKYNSEIDLRKIIFYHPWGFAFLNILLLAGAGLTCFMNDIVPQVFGLCFLFFVATVFMGNVPEISLFEKIGKVLIYIMFCISFILLIYVLNLKM